MRKDHRGGTASELGWKPGPVLQTAWEETISRSEEWSTMSNAANWSSKERLENWLRIESKRTREESETQYLFNKSSHATLARHCSKHWKYSSKPNVPNPHPDGIYIDKPSRNTAINGTVAAKSFAVARLLGMKKKKKSQYIFMLLGLIQWKRERQGDGMISLKRQKGIRCAAHTGRSPCIRAGTHGLRSGKGVAEYMVGTRDHVEILFRLHLYF